MSETLVCIGAVITPKGAALYMANGDVRNLSSDDYRTADIIEKVTEGMLSAAKCAPIILENFSLAKKVEQATAGAVSVKESVGGVLEIKAGEQVLSNVQAEHIEPILKHVANGVGAEGLPLFIENFSKVQRAHSKDEMLEFIGKQNLPIANDGTLIVFKRLRPADNEYFVDCHTGRVRQRVGSIVMMPEGRVDPNCENECSSGFHVASENYIGSFSGNVLVICKVKPQHIIAVPRDYDRSKMRVSEYQIVEKVSDQLLALACRKQFMSSEKGREIIARIVAGHHAAPIEFIEEFEPGKTKVTPIDRKDRVEVAAKKTKIKPVKNIDEPKKSGEKLDPKKINAKVKGVSMSAEKAKEYNEKLKKARKMWKNGAGKTITEIAKTLGMDRNSLAKNLKG